MKAREGQAKLPASPTFPEQQSAYGGHYCRIAPWFVGACIAGYFWFFAGGGLSAGFTHDDLMNLYSGWCRPIGQLVIDSVLFFRPSPAFRPLGALFYRVLFGLFGFNPVAFHSAVYVILLANFWLAYALLSRLAQSRIAGVLAVLLWAYHGHFHPLYANTGTVYDVLCTLFYLLAFLYYMRARSDEMPLGWAQIAAWSVLYILSLNAKEMAVSLPAAILAFEVLSRGPQPTNVLRWIVRDGRVVLVGVGITLLFVAGRVLSSEGISGLGGPYRPVVRPSVYLDRALHLGRQALYDPQWLTPPVFYSGMAVVLLAAAIWRSVPARFGIAWAALALLPIAFITPRGLDAAVIPALGLVLFMATAATAAVDALPGPGGLRFGGLIAMTFAAICIAHFQYGRIDFSRDNPDSPRMLAVYRELKQFRFAKNNRILVLHDPFPEEPWASAFVFYFATGDHSLSVNRLDWLSTAAVPSAEFDRVISWEGEHIVECNPAPFRQVVTAQLPAAVCR